MILNDIQKKDKYINIGLKKKTETTISSLDGKVFTSWMRSKDEKAPYAVVYSTCHYTSSCLYMALLSYIGLLIGFAERH